MTNETIARSHAARERIKAQRPLRALVTGASSGIGREFARFLAEKRHDVVLVARREAMMQELAAEIETSHPVKATVIAQDLSDPAAPASLVAKLEKQELDVDVLINNAGYTMDGHYLSYPWEEHRAYMQVMCLTPAELSYRLLPGMLRRGFGQVVNMASIAGLMPSTPFNALYGPCKNHMVVLSRTLQIEYGGAGVTFSACCPGPVADTPIVDESRHGQAWGRFKLILSDVREVVEKAYAAVEAGKMVQPVGPLTAVATVQSRLLPTQLSSQVGGATILFLGKEKRITSAADAGV
jgi:uncharacterized protein